MRIVDRDVNHHSRIAIRTAQAKLTPMRAIEVDRHVAAAIYPAPFSAG
jgi:hypothetical protein